MWFLLLVLSLKELPDFGLQASLWAWLEISYQPQQA